MGEEFIIHIREKLTDYKRTSELKDVRKLIIRQNLLKDLDFMDGSESLEYAEFHDNTIERFNTLRGFPCLKTLDLGFNVIKSLPDPIQVEGTIEELYLFANKLTRISHNMGLKNLRILEMGCNFIETIEGLEGLENLTELWLGANKIHSVEGIPQLPNLRIISLQENHLTEITELHSLESLEQLLLSNNKIEEIQLDFRKFPKLNILDVSDNPLTFITLDSLSLEMLWMTNTNIRDITHILTIPSLTYINIQGTPAAQDSESISRLKEKYNHIEIFTGHQ